MSNLILTKPSGAGGSLASDVFTTTSEPTGIIDRGDSIIYFGGAGSPQARTFTIEPSGATGSPAYYQYYIKGVKYTVSTAKSITLPDVSGTYFIYLDETRTLFATTDFPAGLLTELAYVAVAYYNQEVNEIVYFGEERHGITMDGATHTHLHFALGTQYITGLTLDGAFAPREHYGSPITGSPFTATDAEVQMEFTGGLIRDEDISLSIVDLGQKTNIYDLEQEITPIAKVPVLYRFGPDSLWRIRRNASSPADTFPFIWSDGVTFTGASGRPAINTQPGSPEGWQLTEVENDKFFLVHLLATNDLNNPIVALAGTVQYDTVPAGAEEGAIELSTLGGLPFQEFVLLYTLVFHTDSSYTNTPKVCARKTGDGDNFVDWRSGATFSSTTGGAITSDHGNLSGLIDDDHKQYHTDARALTHIQGNVDLEDLNNVASGATTGDIITWDGSQWDPQAPDGVIFDRVVVVNSVDDLPTPSGSPIAHRLTPNTLYYFTGSTTGSPETYTPVTLTQPLFCDGDVAIKGLWTFGPVQISYTGTETFLTQPNGFLHIESIRIDCPNSQFIYKDVSLGSPGDYFGGVYFFGLVLDRTTFLGHIHNSTVDIHDCAFGFVVCGNGFHIEGTPGSAGIFSFRQCSFFGMLDGATGITLSSSVFSTVELRDCAFGAPYGGQATGISGLPDSGNIAPGTIASVSGCEFGSGGSPVDVVPLEGITLDDARWRFNNNSNLEDTFPRALSSIITNLTETIIPAANTPIPVAGEWILSETSQFIQSGSPLTTSRIQYVGERRLQIIIDVSVGIQIEAGGGTHDTRLSLWKNGSPYFGSPDTGAGTITVPSVGPTNATRKNITLLWLDTFYENDYIELYIENLENDSNYIINNGTIRLTSRG